MYYGSGTVDRSASGQLVDTAAYASGRGCMCTHQMAVLLCMKWHHGRHLESMMSYLKSNSVNRCVFTSKNNPAKFYPALIWNDRALGLLLRASIQQEEEEEAEEQQDE